MIKCMLVNVDYFGNYSLGSDITHNGIQFMKACWNECSFPVVLIGKKRYVNPFFLQLYYVKQNKNAVFFAAFEHKMGHYHIFLANDKSQRKLLKKIIK